MGTLTELQKASWLRWGQGKARVPGVQSFADCVILDKSLSLQSYTFITSKIAHYPYPKTCQPRATQPTSKSYKSFASTKIKSKNSYPCSASDAHSLGIVTVKLLYL